MFNKPLSITVIQTCCFTLLGALTGFELVISCLLDRCFNRQATGPTEMLWIYFIMGYNTDNITDPVSAPL